MFSRRLKTGYFVLEGLNSFAVVYYFYYFYFFMHKAHAFDNQANLVLAALNGATYAICAWWGGRFAQRAGYFTALKLGFFIMLVALTIGPFVHSALSHIAVMLITVVGMSFTWPTLEALVSEEEPPAGLQHMVGIYNVVWAATAAVANFFGGAMLDKLGFSSLFFVPIAILLTQLGLTSWLQSQVRSGTSTGDRQEPAPSGSTGSESEYQRSGAPAGAGVRVASLTAATIEDANAKRKAKAFLRMAWLANPFAYIAINTLIAVMPGIAARLGLSTTLAGFCCSVWCFSRLAAFAILWQWTTWHYRFRWLLLSYVSLVASFATVLLAQHVAVLVLGQLLFGVSVGLIYYSSLFYSMDLGDTKGEHGGIHEAVIGLGNCAGPAVGAAALYFLPRYDNSGAYAVSLLLLSGLGGLLTIWRGNGTR
ncbi:MAG TPA: MFS transporter [Candidatus Limnocylindrales bacterium]|jgi:predicted MFS family arabinose efflux permease|nr:MFS transporter [Candidatus Limnocylindrales bacterium]